MGQQAGPSMSMSAMNTEMHRARPGRRRRLPINDLAAEMGRQCWAETAR
jgi:hypothetical protein